MLEFSALNETLTLDNGQEISEELYHHLKYSKKTNFFYKKSLKSICFKEIQCLCFVLISPLLEVEICNFFHWFFGVFEEQKNIWRFPDL